jgi:hypothetical protein
MARAIDEREPPPSKLQQPMQLYLRFKLCKGIALIEPNGT